MKWQHRYWVLCVIVSAGFLCYFDRMVMASAIPFIAKDLHLSTLSMGAILSAFFVGYALMQIPGGLLVDRFGPRVVLTASITWWSFMTACTAMAPGLAALLWIRILFGLGEGPCAAASAKAVSQWFPSNELARANGMQLASNALGATVAPLFITAVVLGVGWRGAFYSLFVPGIALAAVVWRHMRNSPPQIRDIRCRESAGFAIEVDSVDTMRSFKECLEAPAIRWCAACLFLTNVVGWGLINWLPTYLLQARGFGIEKTGAFTALTNLAGVLGYPLGGYICDKYFSKTLRVPIVLGLLASAAFTYLTAIAPNGEWAVVSLAMVFLFTRIAGTAIFTVPLVVVSKRAVGSAFGIVNTAGQLAGVVSPLVIGYALSATGGNFTFVLYGLAVLCVLAVYPASQLRQLVSVKAQASGEGFS